MPTRDIRIHYLGPHGPTFMDIVGTDKQLILDQGSNNPYPIVGTGIIVLNHSLVLMIQTDVHEDPNPEVEEPKDGA